MVILSLDMTRMYLYSNYQFNAMIPDIFPGNSGNNYEDIDEDSNGSNSSSNRPITRRKGLMICFFCIMLSMIIDCFDELSSFF